jgi:hypothetical protein
LLAPGAALAIGVCIADAFRALAAAFSTRRITRGLGAGVVAAACLAGLGATIFIQYNDYLMVPASRLTVRYKGGRQWVRLREIGREIGRRAERLDNPKLFVWGWQSPLYFYSGLDSPSRHFFVNDLLRTNAEKPHPLVRGWVDEIMRDLQSQRPVLIFTGYAPFSALARLIESDYKHSRLVPEAEVLWVRGDQAASFDRRAARSSPGAELAARESGLGVWRWLPIPRPVAAQPSAEVTPRTNYPAVEEPRRGRCVAAVWSAGACTCLAGVYVPEVVRLRAG